MCGDRATCVGTGRRLPFRRAVASNLLTALRLRGHLEHHPGPAARRSQATGVRLSPALRGRELSPSHNRAARETQAWSTVFTVLSQALCPGALSGASSFPVVATSHSECPSPAESSATLTPRAGTPLPWATEGQAPDNWGPSFSQSPPNCSNPWTVSLLSVPTGLAHSLP